MKDDVGAPGFLLDDFERVVALAGTLPSHAALRRHSGPARHDRHAVRDDERRVETHAELPNQLRVGRLVSGQLLQEFLGPRFGNRTNVIDHLLTGHADSVVAYRHGTSLCVVADTDREVLVALEQRAVRQRLEPELVARV